ncbi:MAG: hypothetical protein KGH89_03090 [Thaumarchaeota archaeon]|nr:hypothetical protein [Nitrososphaerota archaeon]MDE1866502.1 hypothetical protein [Nitrososphaerota archaeon]
MLNEKGKYASATQNRRLVWEKVMWPLILEIDNVSFTLEQYKKKRDLVCKELSIPSSRIAGGFVSLLLKGILYKEKDLYSIHYRLIPYMRLRADCDYATAVREASTK